MKRKGSEKIGYAFGRAPGFSPRRPPRPSYGTMLGANLSDQIPGGPNLTLTLTHTVIFESITFLIQKHFTPHAADAVTVQYSGIKIGQSHLYPSS